MINLLISSTKNPKVKELNQLRDSKKRRDAGLFLIEGARELSRALASGYICRTLYVADRELNGEARQLVESLPRNLQFRLSRDVFEHVAVRENVDGLLAVMEPKGWTFADLPPSKAPFLLVLEDVEKPGNFGAMARSADGVGIDGIIILDPRADLYNPNAVRASVGAIFSRPLIACSHDEFLSYCRKASIRIIAASPHAKAFHHQKDLRGPLAIVLGSEAWGLSEKWAMAEAVKIPMNGIADSLNVSVAAAVLMYEALRQRSI